MPNKVIIKPDITHEEKLKRLNNVADVLSTVTGFQCKYSGLDEETRVNKKVRKKKASTG